MLVWVQVQAQEQGGSAASGHAHQLPLPAQTASQLLELGLGPGPGPGLIVSRALVCWMAPMLLLLHCLCCGASVQNQASVLPTLQEVPAKQRRQSLHLRAAYRSLLPHQTPRHGHWIGAPPHQVASPGVAQRQHRCRPRCRCCYRHLPLLVPHTWLGRRQTSRSWPGGPGGVCVCELTWQVWPRECVWGGVAHCTPLLR